MGEEKIPAYQPIGHLSVVHLNSDGPAPMVSGGNGGCGTTKEFVGSKETLDELDAKDARIAELEAALNRHKDIYDFERNQADQAREERDVALALLREARGKIGEWQDGTSPSLSARIDAALSPHEGKSE